VRLINHSVVSNDNPESAGVVLDSLGAPGANYLPPGCNPVINPDLIGFRTDTSNFLPAGVATVPCAAKFLAPLNVPILEYRARSATRRFSHQRPHKGLCSPFGQQHDLGEPFVSHITASFSATSVTSVQLVLELNITPTPSSHRCCWIPINQTNGIPHSTKRLVARNEPMTTSTRWPRFTARVGFEKAIQ